MMLWQEYSVEHLNNDGVKALCYELIRITVRDIKTAYKCCPEVRDGELNYLKRVLTNAWFCEILEIDGLWVYESTIRRCERDKKRALERDKKIREKTEQISKSDVSVCKE